MSAAVGSPSRRAVATAMAGAGVLWIALLAVDPVVGLSVVVLQLFVALAIANIPIAVINRRYWPVQDMFIWWGAERIRLYPPATRVGRDEGSAARVDTMILEGTGEPGTWAAIREEAAKLRPPIRREHARAMADLFEKGTYDASKWDAALLDLETDSRRRYWRVRLSLTEGFVRFVKGGDYLPVLMETCSREGPFAIRTRRRLGVRLSRFIVPVTYTVVGIALALIIAFVFGG